MPARRLPAPSPSRPPALAGDRGSGGRTASSSRSPTIAWQGTPAWRRPVATSDTRLAGQALEVQPPLAGDDGPRGAHPRVEAELVEDERPRRGPARPRTRPTARRTSPPAAPVNGTPRGSRASRRASCPRRAAQPPHLVLVGALLRREHARGVLERRCARRTARRALRRPGRRHARIASIAPRAAVGGGAAADAEPDDPRPGVDRRRDQLPGAGGAAAHRVALARRHQARPLAAAVSTIAIAGVPASTGQRTDGLDPAAQADRDLVHSTRSAPAPAPAPERSLAAVGHRAQSPATPAASRPATDRLRATSPALSVPLNESGATSTSSECPIGSRWQYFPAMADEYSDDRGRRDAR